MANNKKSIGTAAGNIYGSTFRNRNRNRGSIPSLNLGKFATDFKQAAGLPDDYSLWDNSGGLNLRVFGKRGPDAITQNTFSNNQDLANINDWLSSLPKNSKLNIEGLPEGMSMDDFFTKVSKGGDLFSDALVTDANGKVISLVDPVKITATSPGDIIPNSGLRIGTLANIGSAGYQGLQAISNLSNANDISATYDELVKDIKKSAAANPMHTQYLTSDQRDMLYRLKNGTYDNPDFGDSLKNVVKQSPKAILAALTGFATGGIPGAVINSVGTAVNSGIQGYSDASQQKQAELRSLYDTLYSAEQDYNSMRRPANLRSSGLQSRYSRSMY